MNTEPQGYDIMAGIRANIATLMRLRGASAAGVARGANLNESSVRDINRGRSNNTGIVTLQKIAASFGVPLGALLGLESAAPSLGQGGEGAETQNPFFVAEVEAPNDAQELAAAQQKQLRHAERSAMLALAWENRALACAEQNDAYRHFQLNAFDHMRVAHGMLALAGVTGPERQALDSADKVLKFVAESAVEYDAEMGA